MFILFVVQVRFNYKVFQQIYFQYQSSYYQLQMINHFKLFFLVLLIAFTNSQVPVTPYNTIGGPKTFMSNIIKMGYSPNQQLMVALVQNDQNIYVYNGLTYATIDFYPTVNGDSVISFAFAPDNSFLIVGTSLGSLFSFEIVNNVITPTPGTIKQNANNEAVRAISVSQTLQIAAGGANQDITLYTLNANQFTLLTTIPYGNTIQSLAYNPDGSILLAGSTAPAATFSSIITVDPYTITQINDFPTRAVASFGAYRVQASATNISILNAADNTVAGTIGLPNANSISISQNANFLITTSGVMVQAWNIANVNTPIIVVQTAGLTFGVSSSGSNLMIQTAVTVNGFQQRGLCAVQQYYISATNNCNVCDDICTVCMTSASTCYACQITAFLKINTCTLCSDVLNDCIQCQDQNTCQACNANGNYLPAPVDGQCVCANGYYIDTNLDCSLCSTAIKGCTVCPNANQCTTCDAANNYVNDDTNNKCKCNNGFYPDNDLNCINCNTLTGCLACTAANMCTTCNQVANFKPVAVGGVCQCQDAYYLNGQTCALCSSVVPQCTRCSADGTVCNACGQGFYPNAVGDICEPCGNVGLGCIDCTDATTCSGCNTAANFAPTPVQGRCVCASTFYLNDQTCQPCRNNIAQCNTCSQDGAVCNSCLPGFFPDATGANCLPCNTNHPGCLLCSADGTACTSCDDTSNFLPTPLQGVCQCVATRYLNVNVCDQCNTKIRFCNQCSQDGATCSQCQAGLNRELNPTNTQCVCDPFYYSDAGQICQLCDDIQKCKVCVNPDTCTTCNDVNHWIVTNQNTCTCMAGYYDNAGQQCIYCGVQGCDKCLVQNTCDSCNEAAGFLPDPQTDPTLQCLCQQKRYKNGETCPLCSSVIDGCVNCDDATTCTLCDTVNHFQRKDELCICSSGYFLQKLPNAQCTSCRTVISNCQTCSSKTSCTTCFDTFVVSADRKVCRCPEDYEIEDGKCVEQGGLSPIVIVAIIVGVLAVAGAGVAIVKCYKKKKSPLQDDQYESLQKS